MTVESMINGQRMGCGWKEALSGAFKSWGKYVCLIDNVRKPFLNASQTNAPTNGTAQLSQGCYLRGSLVSVFYSLL